MSISSLKVCGQERRIHLNKRHAWRKVRPVRTSSATQAPIELQASCRRLHRFALRAMSRRLERYHCEQDFYVPFTKASSGGHALRSVLVGTCRLLCAAASIAVLLREEDIWLVSNQTAKENKSELVVEQDYGCIGHELEKAWKCVGAS